jgi:hypothetical protein
LLTIGVLRHYGGCDKIVVPEHFVIRIPPGADLAATELVIAHTRRRGACEDDTRGSSPRSTQCQVKCFWGYTKPGAKPVGRVCGDDESSKSIAAELICDVGFDPVDAGPLPIARNTEPFAARTDNIARFRPTLSVWLSDFTINRTAELAPAA